MAFDQALQQVLEASNSFTTSLHTSASNPKPRGAGSTIFVGITMELPFKEVGKAEASIVTLKKELEFNALDMSPYEEKVSLEHQQLDKFEAFNKKKKVLLDGRVCISKNRIDKLEVKLKAGQVDVTVLAEDILTLAKTEIAIESLKNDDVMQKLSDLGATGQACKAVYICNVKNFGNSA